MKRALAALLAATTTAAALASCSGGEDGPSAAELASARCLDGAGELYERRIAPLLATDRPRTCNQCHLSGVDLGLFVRDDMCETRACLLELGLVDPAAPEASPILGWIQRAEPESELITETVIAEEYEAFRAFVEQIASCGGESCAGVRCSSGRGQSCGIEPQPGRAALVPEGTPCDDLSIETSFQNSVYAWRDRCFPCHFSNQPHADEEAPRWIQVEGGCDAGSLATLRALERAGDFNLEQPERSFLLLKPLDELGGGVEHGGGQKFHDTYDPSYQSFLSFIRYYAGCKLGTDPY